MKILDCTFRDGGYYTNWDFNENIQKIYFESINKLPIDIIEVGYRNIIHEGYQGEYFYTPINTLAKIKENTDKEIAILIDQKSVEKKDLDYLLSSCIQYIDLVRIAVKPENVFDALDLAKEIKKYDLKVAFNVMYLSEWDKYEEIDLVLPQLSGQVDYFYLVDSFGSVFPDFVREKIQYVKSKTDVEVGFHGHNNIELALINSLTAMEAGATLIDSTITGMGRGAGNLKTELLLSVLNKTQKIPVDFDALSEVTSAFSNLKEEYNWGTSLPYMVSGIRSLPQKNVMEWVSKKFYSLNSVVRALNEDASSNTYKTFTPKKEYKKALIIGGGKTAINHSSAILELLEAEKDICVIHASSKNANVYSNTSADQYFCLVGNEGLRIKKVFKPLDNFNGQCILPPTPRVMGTYVPEKISDVTYELEQIEFTKIVKDSHLAIAMQLSIELEVDEVLFTGFDGYADGKIVQKDQELFEENIKLFKDFSKKGITYNAITPTLYNSIPTNSVYKLL
ncbi:hypothetical protein [Aureivirga sp. CE67]|uniref:hypothetical protein n=1 Tax=Aureivirga sp. CE67 TaxID=1788983 RepID=UPI0018C93001|nr:hypothetical protein [Aureivirga sp. CE67]